MAVRGALAKEEVKAKIFEAFGDKAFINGKEIRISCVEDNEPIEVKITLTAAKDVIKGAEANGGTVEAEPQKQFHEPTAEEQKRMETLAGILF